MQAGTYGGPTVTWSTSKIPESKKEKNYARRVLANATGKKNYKHYLGVPIPEKPSQTDIDEARGILGKKLLGEKASGGIVGEGKKNYAYGGRVAKYKD